MTNYVRVLFHGAGKKARWYWAIQLSPTSFQVIKKDGDIIIKETSTKTTQEVLIGKPLEVKPAEMSMKYAWLIVSKTE